MKGDKLISPSAPLIIERVNESRCSWLRSCHYGEGLRGLGVTWSCNVTRDKRSPIFSVPTSGKVSAGAELRSLLTEPICSSMAWEQNPGQEFRLLTRHWAAFLSAISWAHGDTWSKESVLSGLLARWLSIACVPPCVKVHHQRQIKFSHKRHTHVWGSMFGNIQMSTKVGFT